MQCIKNIRIPQMFINSNDIFSQIGLAVDPARKSNYNTKPKYVICLEIELSQNEKHILQVKDYDDPNKKATEFCQLHMLNKLAIGIVEEKIRQAMEIQQQKIMKHNKQQNERRQKRTNNSGKYASKSQKKAVNNNQKTPKKVNKFGAQSPNASPSKFQSKSKSKTKTKAKNIKTSAQDNIYLRGLVKSRMIQQQRNKIKVQLQRKQQQQLTFKPKINNVSQKIVQFLKTNSIPKIKKVSPTPQMYDEMKQCTFKPKLNKLSSRIMVNKTLIDQQRRNHKNLYNQQKPSNKKQKQVTDQCSFKPQINPKSAQQITLPFFKRLQLNQQKRNQALNKKSFYDEQQCSFQPRIKRGPIIDRNKQNLNIWQYLHNNSKKDLHSQTADCSINNVAKQAALNNQKYYDNLVEDRIRNVFTTLDSDNDGLISPNQIAIQQLPVECLYFLKPVFIQMDQIDASLNYYQFKRAVLALMADSDPGAKGAFISAKWKKQQENKVQFKPNINNRSKAMITNRSTEHLYRDGLKQKQSREYRLQRQRAMKQQRQLMQCSFKPVLARSSKVYIDKISKKGQNTKQIKQSKSISQLMRSHLQSQDNND